MTSVFDAALAAADKQHKARIKSIRDKQKKEQATLDQRIVELLREYDPVTYEKYAARARSLMDAETSARSARARSGKVATRSQRTAPSSGAATPATSRNETTADWTVAASTPDPFALPMPDVDSQPDAWAIPTVATQNTAAPADTSEAAFAERPATSPGQTPPRIGDPNPFDMPGVTRGTSTGSIFDQAFNQ
ncbi:hypothetical protein EDF46_3351 [Frondihabitans sp. PhB188]|uniref:hypothetical protein n=1 Tax=Frondihabitans sp. PhB188 TaxID=2485200 RepID=UPI000F496D47|nr:hypothetical protein [Frondihabitans sp. PhB188]ROQ36802.1 hypothetical protein EDF46_3351 [Frondihabitans sp. PhB188]